MENEKTISIKELCSRMNRLQNKCSQLQDKVFFLESEVLALGNILIKHDLLSLKELESYTSVIVRQKTAQQEIDKKKPIPALKEEFEEALQRKIQQ